MTEDEKPAKTLRQSPRTECQPLAEGVSAHEDGRRRPAPGNRRATTTNMWPGGRRISVRHRRTGSAGRSRTDPRASDPLSRAAPRRRRAARGSTDRAGSRRPARWRTAPAAEHAATRPRAGPDRPGTPSTAAHVRRPRRAARTRGRGPRPRASRGPACQSLSGSTSRADSSARSRSRRRRRSRRRKGRRRCGSRGRQGPRRPAAAPQSAGGRGLPIPDTARTQGPPSFGGARERGRAGAGEPDQAGGVRLRERRRMRLLQPAAGTGSTLDQRRGVRHPPRAVEIVQAFSHVGCPCSRPRPRGQR